MKKDTLQCFGLASGRSPEFSGECVTGKVKEEGRDRDGIRMGQKID